MEQYEKLLSEFPPVTIAEWEAKIKEDLKGADYAKKLIKKTIDNITIKPYYTASDLENIKYLDNEPGKYPFVRGNKTLKNDWLVRQDFKVMETDNAIEKAQLASMRGANSIGYDLSSQADVNYNDFKRLISAIDHTNTSINFIAGGSALHIMDFLQKSLLDLKINNNDFKGSLEFDPLGYLISSGGFYHSEESDLSDLSQLISIAKSKLPYLKVLCVNSHLLCDSGASIVQELAFGLSMLAEYFSKLTEKGHNPSDIAKHLQWNMGAGSDYFMEIAKIRAARILFSGLLSGFEENKSVDTPVFIHSITSNWNKTLYDPNVNLLRLTTEAMAAILGGCDSLLVRPYDYSYNESTDFSERLSRNIQIILKEESHLDKVVDPAAGSFYLESLTDSLIDYAWNYFLKIDEQGGFLKTFNSGFITEQINNTVKQRKDLVASRREILLGTNQYANTNETVNDCFSENIAFKEAVSNIKKVANPLTPVRASAEFEKLRLATERYSGERPKVFLLTYGNLAMRLARAQFSSNFFACAGYQILDNLGFKTAKEGVDAAINANARIIVICSSDDEYAAIAPEVAELVNKKAIVVVAGAPSSMEELSQKGIDEFIHIRSNVLETLKKFHGKLGIELD